MNFQWKNCSTFNNFFTIGWNIMKPTWCTLYSLKAFWLYQECGKRHHGLEDLNMTNKQTTFVDKCFITNRTLGILWEIGIRGQYCTWCWTNSFGFIWFLQESWKELKCSPYQVFVSLRSRLFLEMIRGISTYNWCCVVVLFKENLQSQFCFKFVWSFFG